MRTWIFLLMGVLLGAMGCKNESQEKPPAAARKLTIVNECGKGLIGTPRTPPASNTTDMLVKNYWVFEYYILPENAELGRANEGRWYTFKPDGTFESGQWEQKTCNGNWYLSFPPNQKATLLLDSANDAEDGEFELQGFSPEGMSWVGTKTFTQSSHMIKVINLLTIPTKKQFGRE